MTEDEMFHRGLLMICQQLHMSKTGASDPLDEITRDQLLMYLYKRLENWKCPRPFTKKYDNAVRGLVQATLQEYET